MHSGVMYGGVMHSGVMRAALVLVLCCGSMGTLNAQSIPFVIEEVEFVVSGSTNPDAILNKTIDITGMMFETQEELVAAIKDYQLQINNLRQLQNVLVQYRTVAQEQRISVYVTAQVEDTVSLVILPYLRYSTGENIVLSARLRDYNFLGTLETLSINLDMALTEMLNSGEVKISPKVTIPFKIDNINLYWQSMLDIALTFGGSFSGSFDNFVGIVLPVHSQDWTLEYAQEFDFSTALNVDPLLLGSKLRLKSSIDTTLNLGFMGPLYYRPEFFIGINYWFDDIAQSSARPVEFGYNHSLRAGRINWIHNLRQGIDAKISHNTLFRTSAAQIETSVAAVLKGYLPIGILGLSARIGGELFIPKSASDANIQNEFDTKLRGVPNNAIPGNTLVYLNTDVTISEFRNGSFMEGQANFFADVGFVANVQQAVNIEDNLKLGVGIEALGFFLQARTFIMRLSIGLQPLVSLRTGRLLPSGGYEISIGLGHHY